MRLIETGQSRLLCFDLESRPSAFWYGDKTTAEITAFGWKWLDEPDAHALLLTKDGRFRNDEGRTVSARTAYAAFRLEVD